MSIFKWHRRQAEQCERPAAKTVSAKSRASSEAEARLWRAFAEDLAAPDEPKDRAP
jgi:hypothetical protein